MFFTPLGCSGEKGAGLKVIIGDGDRLALVTAERVREGERAERRRGSCAVVSVFSTVVIVVVG